MALTEKQEELQHAETIEEVGIVTDEEDHRETKWQAVKSNKKTLAWIGIMILVMCLQGFDNQAGGIVIGIEQFRKDFGTPFDGNYVLPAKWQSAYTGGPLASSIAGAFLSGFLADIIGRKYTVLIAVCSSFIGVALEYVAKDNATFFGGKFINGLCIGTFNTICLTYVSEVSPLALRGILTAFCNLALSIGPLICVALATVYGSLPNVWAYRGIFVGQWAFAALVLPFVVFLPESPIWLVSVGKLDQAAAALRRLGCNTVDVEKRIAVIASTQKRAKENTDSSSYLECFRGTNLRRTMITIGPLSIQALSGVAFIVIFSTYYFELAGYSVHVAFQISLGGQGLALLGNICSWFVIDRFGRRPLIFFGTIALTILLFLIGGLATSSQIAPLRAATAFFVLYNFVFNLVMGAVAYTIIAEIPTSRLRAKTIVISLMIQQSIYMVELFVLPYIFNPNEANLGAKTAFIFGGMSLFCIVYLYFCQPETKNRSFAEIDEMFFKKVPARQFGSFITESQLRGQQVSNRRESTTF